MDVADLFFKSYVNFILDILIIFMWGWGILYALSKITKYKRMLLGALGCLGMFLYHIYEGIQNLPNELLVILPQFDKTTAYKSQALEVWQTNGLDNYYVIAIFFFQMCIVASLTGRLKKEGSVLEAKEDYIPEQFVDNDLDYSKDSQESYLEESYASDEYQTENTPQESYASDEYETAASDSYEAEGSENYIEAYSESETNNSNYIAVEAYTSSEIEDEEYDDGQSADSAFFEAEDDPLADEESEEIPQTRISQAPDVEVMDDEEDMAHISRIQTVTDDNIPKTLVTKTSPVEANTSEDLYRIRTTEDPNIFIPKGPDEEIIDPTISCNMEELAKSTPVMAIPHSPDEEIIDPTISCNMEELAKSTPAVAIPHSLDSEDEDIDPTISCNMEDLVKNQDDEMIEEDETFANLGKEKETPDTYYDEDGYEQENISKDVKPEDDKRSLLRNLLPPGQSNKKN